LVLKNREKKVTPVPLPDRITKRMEAAFLMNLSLSLSRVCQQEKARIACFCDIVGDDMKGRPEQT
jgi:hypothetical protein